MKKLILLTLLLIGNYSFSQNYDYEKAEKAQDKIYKDTNLKTGKKFFQDIYGTTAIITYPGGNPQSIPLSVIKSKLQILKNIKKDWYNPNDGDVTIITSYYNSFKEICNDNSNYCKSMDNYHTSKINQANGYWKQIYSEWDKLLKNNSSNSTEENSSNTSSNTNSSSNNNSSNKNSTNQPTNQNSNNSNSSNTNSNNSSNPQTNNSNNSSNTEKEAQKQARKDKERGEQIMRETSDKITEVKQSSTEMVKAVTPLVSGIAKGIADKSIKSIRLMYGTRSFNGESEDGVIYSEALSSDSYELGLSFGKAGFSLGGAFGDGAYAGIVGLYYDAFPGLVSIEDNSFISLGFGAEVGFGFSDQEASETSYSYSPGSNESLTYYSPGIYVLFFKDILYFSYNYGWTSGEETLFYRTDTTTKSLKGTYNKIGFGINIKF